MNPLARLFKKKTISPGNTRALGRHLDTFPTLLSDHDVYENVYASVRPIVNYFTDLEPYAQDINGNKIESSSVDAIYRPNDKFDFTSFMDAVAVGVLTGSEVNILVWRKEGRKVFPGGKLTKDNIGGYTFITKWTTDVYGRRVYERTTENGIETFTDKEVITLVHSRNPHNLSKGYSPAHAARRWTNIDDLMADYQSGHFNNNAVGSGMFLISAPTDVEFEDIKRGLKKHHQGAGKNNGVIYSHAPTDPNTGKQEQATITWVPFNVSNKDLELGTLFDNTNKKIDSSFAVPAVMRGVDSNSTYANAAVSKREFMEGVIRPFAKKIYSQWTHELNRITGGIEAVIKVDVEIPELADEKKVQEETLAIRDNRVRMYLELGYTIDSIDRYLETGKLTALIREVQEDDNPVVSESDNDLAVQSEDNTTVIYAPNKGAAKGTNPKATKELTLEQEADYQLQLEVPTRNLMQAQVDRAVSEIGKSVKEVGDPTEEDREEWLDEMMIVIASILLVSGALQWALGRDELANEGIILPAVYELSDGAVSRYRTYLNTVFDSYSKDTAEHIRTVLDNARANGFTRAETEQAIRGIMDTDAWRVERIGRTEVSRSNGLASVESMQKIQEDAGVRIYKRIQHEANACSFCIAASEQMGWTPVDEAFYPKGATITDAEGAIFVNNWTDIESATLHANCRCVTIFEVREA